MARGIMPHSSSSWPSVLAVPMVCVFPLPVWPYASKVALYPGGAEKEGES